MSRVRPYCAEAQFPGMKPFVGGTVVVSADARHDEIMAALQEHFSTFLPDGFEIIRPVAGALFFVEEEE